MLSGRGYLYLAETPGLFSELHQILHGSLWLGRVEDQAIVQLTGATLLFGIMHYTSGWEWLALLVSVMALLITTLVGQLLLSLTLRSIYFISFA